MKKCLLICAVACSAVAFAGDPLEKFWNETAGRTIRRLPVQVVPENAFLSLSNIDFAQDDGTLVRDRIVRDVYGRLSPYNCITLTLRSRPDLSDAVTQARVKEVVDQAHREGMQVLMDIDVRLARDEFLRRWPDDAQGRLAFEVAAPTNGVATFRMVPEFCGDHLTYGARRVYDVYRTRLVDAWAVRVDADGVGDPATLRKVTDRICRAELGCVLSGRVEGLRDDERLVALGEFTHWSADVFSPHLIPFTHELMARYKALGADGAMHDEWGFPSTHARQRAFRSFWHSRHFAAAYAARTGRDMVEDALLVVQPLKGREAERRAAIDAYFALTFERNVAIETDFYDENKRLWGPDVYVTKHATWCPIPLVSEYFHNGLSWWGAKRDWAQSDEQCEVSHCLGMMRTFGGPCWMNEGYGPDAQHYPRNVWRYALCGGRMVYHGIYGGTTFKGLPAAERRIRSQRDILTCGGAAAESRVRLLNLISRAQPASAAAFVFGHFRLMNRLDPAYQDYGRAFLHALGRQGWQLDSFPSTALSALRVDAEGYVCAGEQRYPVVFLHRLSADDVAGWRRFTGGRTLATRIVAYDSPPVDGAQAEPMPDAATAARLLEQIGAVKQTPFGKTGLMRGSINLLPDPDGTLKLLDGTVARIKGCTPDPTGDPIEGTLSADGTAVEYAARGIFAVRVEKGEAVALAAGALTRVKAPGLELALDRPIDVALVKRNGAWRGLLQVPAAPAEVPAPLRRLTDDWRILIQPDCRTGACEGAR